MIWSIQSSRTRWISHIEYLKHECGIPLHIVHHVDLRNVIVCMMFYPRLMVCLLEALWLTHIHKYWYIYSFSPFSFKIIQIYPVSVTPNIAKQPRSSSNNVGTSAEFRCVNSGIPTPTVTWYKDGKPLVVDSRHQVSSNGEILTITNIRRSDAGNIECRAANAVGITSSREAVLTVVWNFEIKCYL